MKRHCCDEGEEVDSSGDDQHTTFFFSQDDLVMYMLGLIEDELTWFRLRCVSRLFHRILGSLIDTNVLSITDDGGVREICDTLTREIHGALRLIPPSLFARLDAYNCVPYRLKHGRVCMIEGIIPIEHDEYTPLNMALFRYVSGGTTPAHKSVYTSIFIPMVMRIGRKGMPDLFSEYNWLRDMYNTLCRCRNASYYTVVVALNCWPSASEKSVRHLCQFIESGVLHIYNDDDDYTSPLEPFVLPPRMNLIILAIAARPNRFYVKHT